LGGKILNKDWLKAIELKTTYRVEYRDAAIYPAELKANAGDYDVYETKGVEGSRSDRPRLHGAVFY